MSIKIEITANNAEGLAAKLHELVQTFVALANPNGPAPFASNANTAVVAPEPVAEEPKRTRKRAAPVVDASAEPSVEPPKTTKAVTPDEVRAMLNKLRSDKGNAALGEVVTQFAPKFSDIPESSYPALYEAAQKKLAA